MYGYYVQKPSPWHDVGRTLCRPINNFIFPLRMSCKQVSCKQVSFIDVWTSSFKEIVGKCKYMKMKNRFHDISEGQICLWREDSLKEKYNTKYFKNKFLINFPCMQVSSDGPKHIFWLFLLCLSPHTTAGMNIKDGLFQNTMIMASYCMFNFYSHSC